MFEYVVKNVSVVFFYGDFFFPEMGMIELLYNNERES